MEDADVRGKLLQHFHGLRHNNEGWVPLSDMIVSPVSISLNVLGSICDQLADIGLITWKPLRTGMGLVAGSAKITGKGVAVVEAGKCADIDIRFPASPSAASADAPVPEAALSEIFAAVGNVEAELPVLSLSNSAKAEIIADIKQIEIEAARPTPRRKFLKTFLDSLRDNLAKASATGLVALIASLIAKYFHVF